VVRASQLLHAITDAFYNQFTIVINNNNSCSGSGGSENTGVENAAGVENTEAITYGKPSKQKTRVWVIQVCNQPPKANSAFHPFGVDKLSSEQLYRMCAGRTIC